VPQLNRRGGGITAADQASKPQSWSRYYKGAGGKSNEASSEPGRLMRCRRFRMHLTPTLA